MGRFRLPWVRKGRGGGAFPGAQKKLRIGIAPSGTNTYTEPTFFYDEAKRAYWTAGGSQILPLNFPYAFPTGTSGASYTGWNTTTDGSQLSSYEYGLTPAPVLRNTIKMDNDGWIDIASFTSVTGAAAAALNMPSMLSLERRTGSFQVRFPFTFTDIGGVSISGTGVQSGSVVCEDSSGFATWSFTATDAGVGKGTGVGNPSVIGLSITITVTLSKVIGGRFKRPKVVPHPGNPTLGIPTSSNARSPEPVGDPIEFAKLKTVAVSWRDLDARRINGRDMNGDTITQLRLRDVEPTDYLFASISGVTPYCSLDEAIAMSNENGLDLWCQFSHRDSDALQQTNAQKLANVIGNVTVEYSNEVWNTSFVQNSECTVMGLRKGFALLNYSTDAPSTPPTIYWPNKHVNTATVTTHAHNDQIAFNGSSYGLFVLRARQDLTSTGVKIPVSNSSTTTTKVYFPGDMIMGNSVRTIWTVRADVDPVNGVPIGTARTNTAYFTATDNTTDDATAVAAGCPWDMMLCGWETLTAQYNYRSWMSRRIGDWVDAARIAVGKSKCTRIINVGAGVTSIRLDLTNSSTEPAWMLNFDKLWRYNHYVTESVYICESGTAGRYFTYAGKTTGTDWDQQARFDVYRTDISATQAISNALDKMLSPASRAGAISVITQRFLNLLLTGTQPYTLTTFLANMVSAHNAANPTDQVDPASIVPLLGSYEVGGPGNNKLGSPDETGNWSSSASYSAGTNKANFAYVGSALYRCKGTATVGLSPASDSANWEVIPSYVDPISGDSLGRWSGLMNAFWRDPRVGNLMTELWTALQNFAATYQQGYGVFNIYTSLHAELTAPNSGAYGYRWSGFTDATHSPAWAAMVNIKTAWDALP